MDLLGFQKPVKASCSSEARLESLAGDSLASFPKKRKILVVDDLQINRKLLGRVLQKLDYEVVEAANGEEAVDMYSRHSGCDAGEGGLLAILMVSNLFLV